MIAYFSGTGNSQYIARLIADKVGDDLYSINDGLKNGQLLDTTDKKVVFVLPIYAWQMPKVVEGWIKKGNLKDKKVYFVFTCGGDMGAAARYARKAVEEIGGIYQGALEVVMPDNCITLFTPPTEEESLAIIAKAEEELKAVIDKIASDQIIEAKAVSIIAKLQSGFVNKGFYKYFVKGSKLYATDACISCGECVKTCPLNNITMVDGKPKFQDNCTQCMSCVCRCVTGAIEYGKSTIGRRRYLCPKQ